MADNDRSSVILDWNLANWITITLMAGIGVGVLALAEKLALKFWSKKVDAA